MNPLIETDRFHLVKMDEKYVTEKYLSWFQTIDRKSQNESYDQYRSLHDLIKYVSEKSKRSDVLFLGIFEKGNKDHIGNIKYEPLLQNANFTYMGILIGEREWQGKGVAQEVILATAKYLKAFYNIQIIKLGVYKENSHAYSAYSRLGFRISDTAPLDNSSDSIIRMEYCIP